MKGRLSLYKLRADKLERREKYFKDYLKFARLIKKRAEKIFSKARVLVFGSVIRGDYLPDSDIDILVISKRIPFDFSAQVRLKKKLAKNFPDSPFQIHLVSPEIYEKWYKNFIKDNYVEV